MKPSLFTLILVLFLSACQPETWCDQPLRPELTALKAVTTNSDWFEVYEVGKGVYAIAEPYNFQEVISYLIIGDERALLFDSGMGMASMSKMVGELTSLPVTVLNSHTHYDHIGGNHEFDNVLAMDTEYTRNRAKNGMDHSIVAHEVTAEAFCQERNPDFDSETYHIKPFEISRFVKHTEEIDLGNRTVQVVAVPGHTIDAIALLDQANGYLWTGDTFYEAPIWLFDEGTDLQAYQESVKLLANLASGLQKVFPAHNSPVSDPEILLDLRDAFNSVMSGDKTPQNNAEDAHTDSDALIFEFEHFSFVIQKDAYNAINNP